MNIREPYNPAPEICEMLLWSIKAMQKYRGTEDEEHFRKIAQHLEKELRKYLIN